MEGCENVGQQICVGRKEISCEVINFGHILKTEFYKIKGIFNHNVGEGPKEDVISGLSR